MYICIYVCMYVCMYVYNVCSEIACSQDMINFVGYFISLNH